MQQGCTSVVIPAHFVSFLRCSVSRRAKPERYMCRLLFSIVPIKALSNWVQFTYNGRTSTHLPPLQALAVASMVQATGFSHFFMPGRRPLNAAAERFFSLLQRYESNIFWLEMTESQVRRAEENKRRGWRELIRRAWSSSWDGR